MIRYVRSAADRALLKRLTSRVRIVTHFFAAQGINLVGNVLYGLLCLRLLPPTEYAKFVVVFAVQGTLIVLMDANFTLTLGPLVGERLADRRLIADYLASLRQLSNWVYALMGIGLVVLYPFLVKNRGWSPWTVAFMILVLLISTWFMRIGSAYGAVLILLRDRSYWYKGQTISSLGTLALLLAFCGFHWLGPFSAILINVSGIVFVGIFYFHRAGELLGGTGEISVQKRNAIVRLALPNIPQTIFYALQGQLSLFLITFLGHTKSVASVGALARLGQLFALILQLNPLIIEPYFAKLPVAQLKKSYAVALLLMGFICATVTALACQVPQLFLWVLGPQYNNLRTEVELAIGASAIGCFSGVLWGIHSARRFVYWWNFIFSGGLTIAAQIGCIVLLDMSTVRGVLLLTMVTNIAFLLANVISGVYGFWKGPRKVEESYPAEPNGGTEEELCGAPLLRLDTSVR
jgi:O-antigen/teichoic acid export membrane protein